MKNLCVVVVLSLVVVACDKKIDFNEGARLDPAADGSAVRNPDAKELNCGAEPFIVNYSNVDSTVGTLEVTNNGVCKVNVNVAEDVGGAAARTISRYDVESGVGNVTAFPMTARMKIRIIFTCAPSTAEGKCKFSYRFSTGKEAKTPARESVAVDATPEASAPGLPGGNSCITPNGKEHVVKVISNRLTNGDMTVNFTAESKCKCNPFIAYAEPADPGAKKSKQARAAANGTDTGFVVVPKNQTTQIKIKCDGGSLTTETCKGLVRDIRVSITTK
ncbi:MAG: hypothetical protein ACJ8KO_07225 [Sulfurifustaceae bacterium]